MLRLPCCSWGNYSNVSSSEIGILNDIPESLHVWSKMQSKIIYGKVTPRTQDQGYFHEHREQQQTDKIFDALHTAVG